jgi:predicted ArsR family transcriptional regulator
MSTRERILEILENRPAMTAVELANILHLTPANIRYHMGHLERDGRVVAAGDRPPHGRGRPQQLFALPQRGTGIERLAEHLLDQALENLPPDQQAGFLRAIAVRLGGETDSGRHITQRLGATVRRLNELEYQARSPNCLGELSIRGHHRRPPRTLPDGRSFTRSVGSTTCHPNSKAGT